MAVPGIIFAGSVIQRAVQAACRRSLRQQEIRGESVFVVRLVAGHMAFQAGGGGAGEQAAGHGAFGVVERLDFWLE